MRAWDLLVCGMITGACRGQTAVRTPYSSGLKHVGTFSVRAFDYSLITFPQMLTVLDASFRAHGPSR